jgi:hypothetical protein
MTDHPAFLHLERVIQPDEQLQIRTDAGDAALAVTDRRLVVADARRLMLDTSFDELRRIQFDIEKDRPATLVIVPESPRSDPQVLAIPPERFDEVSQALAFIGRRLAGIAS